MPHKNFYQFSAKNNFELGLQMGERFSEIAKTAVERSSVWEDWKIKVERAKIFLKFNQQYFPEYVEEMRGYAKGAGVEFMDLYTLSLEDEVNQDYSANRCSTIITNSGLLIAHNEDWEKWSEDKICVVEKEISGKKILELYYYNTLGGNSVSINSHGFMVCINSLISRKMSPGLSKNVIARWLSETQDPEADFKKLEDIPRVMGYSGNIVRAKDGKIWNLEYNSESAIVTRPPAPFVHTNHYLTALSKDEANTNIHGTFNRYNIAKDKARQKMSVEDLQKICDDKSDGAELSIMNERTIAKIIVDLEQKFAKIWLLREPELGFVDYDLTGLFQ